MPIGFVPTRSGTSRTILPVNRHFAMAGIGSRVRVEFERGLGGGICGGELLLVERDRSCAGLEDLPVARAGQGDGGEIEVESAGERAREDGDRLAAFGDDQDVAAQIEQPRQFVAASQRLLRAGPGHRRQIAGDKADREKREQRHPVVRIRNRERADGGRKKKLKHRTATSDVATATHSRDVAATTRTTIRNVIETVVGVRHMQPPDIDEGDSCDAENAESEPNRVGVSGRHRRAS